MSAHAEDEDYGKVVSGLSGPRPSSPRHMKPTPVTVSGVSFVSTFWLVCTIFVLCGLVIVAAFPRWVHNDVNSPEKRRELDNLVHRVDFGLYHFCYELTASLDQTTNNASFEECTTYLQYSPQATLDGISTNLAEADLKDIAFLFSASILYAFAFLVLLLSLIMGVVAYLKPKVLGTSMFAMAFVFQVIGGVALVISLALLPVSFESEFMSQFCGHQASYYYRGMCTVDWGLYVVMVITACALYLPSLAIFAMNISDGLRANICC
jgi:hypothetical protein